MSKYVQLGQALTEVRRFARADLMTAQELYNQLVTRLRNELQVRAKNTIDTTPLEPATHYLVGTQRLFRSTLSITVRDLADPHDPGANEPLKLAVDVTFSPDRGAATHSVRINESGLALVVKTGDDESYMRFIDAVYACFAITLGIKGVNSPWASRAQIVEG